MYYLEREKIIIILGSVLAVALLFLFFILPTLNDMAELRVRIEEKQTDMKILKDLGEDYRKTKEAIFLVEASAIEQNEKAVLLSAIEKLVLNAGIDKTSVTINSRNKALLSTLSKNDIELSFKKVSRKDLHNLITSFNTYSHIINIEKLHIKTRFDNPSFLDGTIDLSVLEKE
jgi:hypothetical protein